MTDFGRRGEHGAAQNRPGTGDARVDWGGEDAPYRTARVVKGTASRQPGVLERLGNRLHRLNEFLKPYGLNL